MQPTARQPLSSFALPLPLSNLRARFARRAGLPAARRLVALGSVSLAAVLASAMVGCGGGSNPLVELQFTNVPAFSALTTSAAASAMVTLSNPSPVDAQIKGFSITGDSAGVFMQQNTCPATLKAGASCTVTVSFLSAAAGTFNGSLNVADNGFYGGMASTALTGTATVPTPALKLSTSAVTFTGQTAGSPGAQQTVTLTDSGTAPLALSSIALTGSGANLFTLANGCGSTLAVGASCNVTTGFAPRLAGSYTASIAIASNATPATQAVSLAGTATAFAMTIDTTIPTDWKINNGTMTFDFNSVSGHVFAMTLAGFADPLIEPSTTSGGQPQGLYMDNSGLGSATAVPGFLNAGTYLDWWVTYPSSSTNAYTYSEHFITTPNDPGLHVYFVANHAATDIAGSIGQVQWVLRENLNDFNTTYAVDPSLNNPGATVTPLPPASENFTTAAGRAVQDATVDLHGLPVPTGFTRNFYTKYDYSSYNYLHVAHGVYGSQIGVWNVFPSTESQVGGPSKQNLIFTGNLLITEAYSNHLDNALTLATPAGTASQRLFGPFYIRFNQPGQAYSQTGQTLVTPADQYADAVSAGGSFGAIYNADSQLATAGYVPSTARGAAAVQVSGLVGSAPKSAWAVLSDAGKNFQYSSAGAQYWADISSTGKASFTGVIPGTYRLSVYQLGQWGEYRQDGIVIKANGTTTVPAIVFQPESFGTPVWTIGTADRSSHEFLHGHDAKGFDDREYWGSFNYWADFAANNGAVIYNATAGPAGAATNDLSQWNYNHWQVFNPGLYAGVYNSADQTTAGYKYAIPAYVATLPGAAGTNGTTTKTPAWQVHFATPANAASFQFATVSVALACDAGSYVLNLNGTARTWGYRTAVASDCAVRSGLSGYTQWIAFDFPVTALNPSGADNLLTIGVSQTAGAMDDALRLELSVKGAAPSVTGFNDYEYVGTSSTAANIPANDAVANP